MTKTPTLTLCIAVYKGGTYWKECWDNVKILTQYFDAILISFNKSELQMTDVSVILADKPENVTYLIQPEFLEPVAHHSTYLKYLNTDYVFFLCHDDWLLEPGLKEIRPLLNISGSQIAIFGSHEWSESEITNPGITRELLAFPLGITVDDFILKDIDKYFTFSISGVVCPVEGLKEKTSMRKLFSKGFRYDNFVVTYPGIKRIFQTEHPSVRIRLHSGQESRQSYPKERNLDNMTYYFIQGLYGDDDEFNYRTVNQMIQWASALPVKDAITHFLNLLKVSRNWDICYKNYVYFGLILSRSFLKKMFSCFFGVIKAIGRHK